jgi:hypothetical protein
MKNLSSSRSIRCASRSAALTSAVMSLGLLAGLAAQAQTNSETIGDFESLLSQYSTTYVDPTVGGANVGPNACVPTAVAQGLSYLEGYASANSAPDPFGASPNTVTAINALASAMSTSQNSTTGDYGTTYPDRVTGTQSYLAANPAPTVAVVGGQYASSYSSAATTGPTSQSTMMANSVASFIANGLGANDGVEFAILWGSLGAGNTFAPSGGGHFVTAQSISYDPTTGLGTINFIDPGTGTLISEAHLIMTSTGNLYVAYPGGPPAADADVNETAEETYNPALDEDGAVGIVGGLIVNDMAEAVVPEPGTLSLVAAGVTALLAFRKRSRA